MNKYINYLRYLTKMLIILNGDNGKQVGFSRFLSGFVAAIF